MRPKYLPAPLFNVGDEVIMCSKAAGIVGRFDLGGAALYPVSEGVWAPDPNIRDPEDWFCFAIANTKTAFSEAHSPLASGEDGPEFRDICVFPWTMADETIAVSREAMEGPDVWIDRALARSVFLSRALGDALDAAGLREPFRLYRASVI